MAINYLDNSVGADTRYFSPSSFGIVKRNLTFNGTQFRLNGVQNRAVFSSLSNMSQDNLQNFAQIINKNLDTNEIKTSSNLAKNYEFSNEISFTDKISTNTINLRLSDENLSRLKTHFGSQNFDKDKSGKITLKGEAADFVSGWFGDIAYKRNYVGADSDKNGFLNDSEKGETLAGYSVEATFQRGKSSNVSSVDMQGLSSYLSYNKHYDSPLANTIEKALNESLKADINMDGYLNLGELQSKEQIADLTKKNVENKTLGLADVFETFEQFLQKMSREDKETLKKRLDIENEKQLNAENYATSEDLFNALESELKELTKSLSVSFKVSEELVIKNLDNPNFTNDMRSLISEISASAAKSVQIDISA